METIGFALLILQAFGAVAGTVAAMWSEMAYLRAMRDGRIDAAEDEHLLGIATGLRYGMTLVLLSSIVLIFIAYQSGSELQPALSPNFWTFIILSLVIVLVSWALSRHTIAFPLGSAIVFTGWWFLMLQSLGQLPIVSFGSSVAFFVVAVAIFYALLQYMRFLAMKT